MLDEPQFYASGDGFIPEREAVQIGSRLRQCVRRSCVLYTLAVGVIIALGMFFSSVRSYLGEIISSFLLSALYGSLIALLGGAIVLIPAWKRLFVYAKTLTGSLPVSPTSQLEIIDEQGNVLGSPQAQPQVLLPPLPPRVQVLKPVTHIFLSGWAWCWGIELLQLTALPATLTRLWAPLGYVVGSTYSTLDLFSYLPGVALGTLICLALLLFYAANQLLILSSVSLQRN